MTLASTPSRIHPSSYPKECSWQHACPGTTPGQHTEALPTQTAYRTAHEVAAEQLHARTHHNTAGGLLVPAVVTGHTQNQLVVANIVHLLLPVSCHDVAATQFRRGPYLLCLLWKHIVCSKFDAQPQHCVCCMLCRDAFISLKAHTLGEQNSVSRIMSAGYFASMQMHFNLQQSPQALLSIHSQTLCHNTRITHCCNQSPCATTVQALPHQRNTHDFKQRP